MNSLLAAAATYAWETAASTSSRPGQKKGPETQRLGPFGNNAGSDLLSHTVSHTVPSAVSGLTSVFGMGTGGTLIL